MPTATPMIPPSAIGVSNTRWRAVLRLQPVGAAEHAAEVADVLAEDTTSSSRSSITSIAERSATFIAIAVTAPALQLRRCCCDEVRRHRPRRRPRRCSWRSAAGRRAACRSALGLLRRGPHLARSASARSSRAVAPPTTRRATMRWRSSRSIGSPSGHAFHSSAGRYRDGSSDVEWAATRYVTHSMSVGPWLRRARSRAQRVAATTAR